MNDNVNLLLEMVSLFFPNNFVYDTVADNLALSIIFCVSHMCFYYCSLFSLFMSSLVDCTIYYPTHE